MIEEYLIRLKPQELSTTLRGVYKLPFEEVSQLVGIFHTQIQDQEKEVESGKEKKASKTAVSEVKSATR